MLLIYLLYNIVYSSKFLHLFTGADVCYVVVMYINHVYTPSFVIASNAFYIELRSVFRVKTLHILQNIHILRVASVTWLQMRPVCLLFVCLMLLLLMQYRLSI